MSTRAEPAEAELGEPSSDEQQDAAPVVFLPEPGACAGRLDPGQDLVPDWLADRIDFHVWPSASPYATSARARTVCEHIDYAQVWHEHPELFARRQQVGVPALEDLWEAKRLLAEFGTSLAFDVQLEEIDGELALAVYGAGVVGRLSDAEWREVASLLTTCCSMLHEPREDIALIGRLVRPARRPVAVGKRDLPTRVRPVSWEIGDWIHTWWGFPFHGTLAKDCGCSAHTPEAAAVHFGPGVRASA